MNLTFIAIYAHLVGAVLLVGYCLFWALVTAATWREYSGSTAEQLLQAAKSAAWPLPGYPPKLPLIGWLIVAFVVGSGVLAIVSGASAAGSLGVESIHMLRGIKVILLVVLVACMTRLGSSRPFVAWLSLSLALLIVAMSAQLIR